ncbi:FtsX-like permease family protein [Flavobacterium sp. NST-5]|uniref:FtsX-like permease family protein n=1 Tax=Flavobacterium ichthyis TaxID=2698827 RepID=A0ABW9Z952_9FLAO|nr:ABC transporter permease [Flavobacterium ichthyis]NBL63882.1 FtsX-like permease family protein [Flavobacterium ichthyis]
MILYLRLLRESFGFAFNALRNNKLRTILSLLGVTIGIFSIIAVLAAVDSLDRKIKSDMSSLDKNTMYLKRFSFAPTEVPRWKREQFPDVTYDEFQYLKSSVTGMEKSTYQLFTKREILKFEGNTASDVNVVPATNEFVEIQSLKFMEGRFFNEAESNSGATVVIVGYEIANTLFGNLNPMGQKIRIYGQKFTVIGVLEKQGQGMFGDSNDTSIYIPVNFLRNKFGDHNDFMTPIIVIKPVENVDVDAFQGEIIQKLRSRRGLKAGDDNNFFIDILSGFTVFIDQIVGTMNMIGWAISFFSLLVGGFGVANIMFVSVKERTNLIGIQKSLGAKNKFILLQFLFEAIILCLIGGTIGLLLVWGIAAGLTKMLEFEFVLSFSNIVIGTSLAIGIGLISGILPAISASKLDPVEAIRTGM